MCIEIALLNSLIDRSLRTFENLFFFENLGSHVCSGFLRSCQKGVEDSTFMFVEDFTLFRNVDQKGVEDFTLFGDVELFTLFVEDFTSLF